MTEVNVYIQVSSFIALFFAGAALSPMIFFARYFRDKGRGTWKGLSIFGAFLLILFALYSVGTFYENEFQDIFILLVGIFMIFTFRQIKTIISLTSRFNKIWIRENQDDFSKFEKFTNTFINISTVLVVLYSVTYTVNFVRTFETIDEDEIASHMREDHENTEEIYERILLAVVLLTIFALYYYVKIRLVRILSMVSENMVEGNKKIIEFINANLINLGILCLLPILSTIVVFMTKDRSDSIVILGFILIDYIRKILIMVIISYDVHLMYNVVQSLLFSTTMTERVRDEENPGAVLTDSATSLDSVSASN